MLRLSYSGISDVGRVRKDNQDSGYAGPHLLAVCDGVGGAARGDIASSVAIAQLRRLDVEPTDDPLALIAGALQRAHDKIAEELVDAGPLPSPAPRRPMTLGAARRRGVRWRSATSATPAPTSCATATLLPAHPPTTRSCRPSIDERPHHRGRSPVRTPSAT
jgi:hypothetical protein